WCQPTNGTHNFFFPLDQTITDTDENQAGKIVKESWSVGGEYSARCDCDNKDYQGVNYFTATTGDLTQKGTYSEAGSNGQQMDFYVLVAGKLEIGTETYIVGNLKQYIPVPFSAISNQDPTAGGCTGADINKMSAGNKGNVRIYITHPLVGEITIPETTIMNLYLSKTP
ncbi:fimbrial protein StiH, partial [Salmonella enterica subsp. enterica serovar Meleagridis]|nr:fimbrial protein StiH [Salmonella enterica subsp. enterica serovar Meleagridis]